MVCKKCEKKLSTIAAPTPGQASTSKTRTIGENKLLTAKKRGTPYGTGKRCMECKQSVQQNGASRCGTCAYKKGVCAICGTMILDTSRYKQSSA